MIHSPNSPDSSRFPFQNENLELCFDSQDRLMPLDGLSPGTKAILLPKVLWYTEAIHKVHPLPAQFSLGDTYLLFHGAHVIATLVAMRAHILDVEEDPDTLTIPGEEELQKMFTAFDLLAPTKEQLVQAQSVIGLAGVPHIGTSTFPGEVTPTLYHFQCLLLGITLQRIPYTELATRLILTLTNPEIALKYNLTATELMAGAGAISPTDVHFDPSDSVH